MYTCKHCGDPATQIEKHQEPFWPFKLISTEAYCYQCHAEVFYGKLPRLTDSSFRSKKGSGIQKRNRLTEG